MDPIDGTSPSNPRLDSAVPRPNQTVNPAVFGDVLTAPVAPPVLEAPSNPNPAPIQLPVDTFSDDSLLEQTVPEKPKKRGKGKKAALIILSILLIAGLAAGAYFVGFSMGKSTGKKESDIAYQKEQAALQQDKAEDPATASIDEPGATAATLTLGDLKDPKYIDETITGETGKQVSASDGLVLKVTNIERNFKSTDTNYKLDASKELVKVNFIMGNVTKIKAKDLSSFNFRLENSVNALLTPENIATYPDKFDTIKLDPGAQSKGSIVYSVNKDEKPLKFVREQRYRISGENREVTTRIVISIAK